jgi:hypothetical protein
MLLMSPGLTNSIEYPELLHNLSHVYMITDVTGNLPGCDNRHLEGEATCRCRDVVAEGKLGVEELVDEFNTEGFGISVDIRGGPADSVGSVSLEDRWFDRNGRLCERREGKDGRAGDAER